MNTIKKLMTLLLILLAANTIAAYDFEKDSIYYILNKKNATATVVNYNNSYVSAEGDPKYSGDIVIPESITTDDGCTYMVTSIGNYAFASCRNLTSVNLPNSILSLGEAAFINCTGLASITIPNSVILLGVNCFSGCTGLTELSLPETLAFIGDEAFSGCVNLAEIYIPDSVTEIGLDVFNRTAWLNNQPEGVVYAGPFAYSYKGTMPENTVIDLKPGIMHIAEYAFLNCVNLVGITMPNSLTSIKRRAFMGCTGLESIKIPTSLTSIGERAFENCSNLMSIDFPKSIKFIGESAFSRTGWYDMQPDGLVYIGTVAYHYKGKVPEHTHFSFQEGTTSIADAVFFADEKYYYRIDNYEGLISVNIPNSVKYIGNYVFLDVCTNLSKITIGSGVEDMGYWSMASIPNLTEVYISEGVKLIGQEMFSRCYNLKKITIPNSVEVIKYRAFSAMDNEGDIDEPACISLTEITIGSGVKFIEDFAFSGCTALTKIISLATTPPIIADGNCFDNQCYDNATLYVPAEVVDVYRNTPIWDSFINILPIGSDNVPGDMNGDGEVNIADVNTLIEIVLTEQTDSDGDVNNDGEVNIADINAIICIILNASVPNQSVI